MRKSSVFESDLCIVGGGAAGITLALCLKDLPVDICLLESGELTKDETMQKLNEIETTDLPIAEPSRARQFGGTTALWVGRWKPHDTIDFEKRSWIKHSGWPITLKDLEPYYKKAAEVLSAPSFESFDPDFQDVKRYYKLNGGGVETVVFRWFEKNGLDWGRRYRKEFEDAERIKVLLRAVVTRLKPGKNGKTVEEAEVKTLEGNAFSVKAKYFILAAGGLENPRLLLLSGIGNEYDQVGRYYMDHPKGLVGKIEITDENFDLSLYRGFVRAGRRVGAGLRLSDAAQAEHKVLNSYVMPEPFFPWSYNGGVRAFWELVLMAKGRRRRNISDALVSVLKILQNGGLVFRFLLYEFKKRVLKKETACRTLALWNFMEQEPRPEQRVTLSDEKDLLGLPKITLSWSFGDLDKKTMSVLHKVLAAEFEKIGLGKLNSPLLEENGDEWPIQRDASHHMGTTRMGDDPKTSVVDRDCKVHGVDNLYVAGSSVFATSGYANPTYTIAALAVRLAERIRGKFVQS